MASTAATISEQEFRELVRNDPERDWELWDGVPVEKPAMSMRHNATAFRLGFFLQSQLDWDAYRVNVNGDRTGISPGAYYIPDVIVIRTAYQLPFEDDPRAVGAYADPLPFVAEVWSPSTGRYDVATKLEGYRQRGDREIWFLRTDERTLIAERRQPDGSYAKEIYHGGIVPVLSLPGVTIDLDVLLGGRNWPPQP